MNKLTKNEFNISIVLSYVYIVLNAATGVIIVPLLLGKENGNAEYGLYMLVVSTYLFFNVDGLGIGGVLIRKVKKHLMFGVRQTAVEIHVIIKAIWEVESSVK